MKYTRDNRARLAETKDKPTVTIQLVEAEKKKGRKPKERKRQPSDLPNWRNKDVPLPVEEEISKEELKTQGEETPTVAAIEETTEDTAQESEVTTDQEEEETQAHINVNMFIVCKLRNLYVVINTTQNTNQNTTNVRKGFLESLTFPNN